MRTKKELVSLDGRTLYWHNKDILSLQEIVENTKEDFLLKKEILKAVGLCFHEIKGIEKKKYLMIDNDSDFGVAKSQLIESRSFNSLKIHPLFPEIVKSSTDKQKLEYEVFWYQGVPEQFRALTPRILKYDESGVRMEYYGYGTLTEKFLYDNLPLEEWEIVLRKLFRIVDLFSREKIESNQNTFRDFYLNKFSVRCERARELPELGELFGRKQIVVNGVKYRGLPKLISFIKRKLEEISETAVGSIGHGDLCFNNILYDRGSGVIKLIDPRGNIGGVPSIMCDSRYDIAKLKHSFCGNYDGVVEGEFFLDENDNGFDFYLSRSETVRDRELLFKQLCLEFGFCFETISFIEAYLFLTMIPLHKDSVRKMKAFFLISIVKFNQCLEFQDENLCRS